MLSQILGSKIAEKCFLSIYKYKEIYATAISKDFGITKSAVQKQLERFEDANILVSRTVGKTRVYSFNQKYPPARKLEEIVKMFFDNIPLEEKENIFTRRRPRRKGKPVLKKNQNMII